MRNRQIKLVGDHDETLDLSNPKHAEIHRREMNVARHVMAELQQSYPGHPWAVRVDGKGIAKAVLIKLPAIMRARDHYVIPMPMLMRGSIGDFQRLVRHAGGELLERFNIPRSGFLVDPFLLARQLHLRAPGAKVPS